MNVDIETHTLNLKHDVPFDDYLHWEIVSTSVLKEGRKSMAHMKAMFDGTREIIVTDDMDLGSALHCAFLEPELMPEKVVLWEGKRRAGKEWDAFKGEHSDKVILTPGYYEKLQGMTKSLRKHQFVKEWYGRIQDVEVSGQSEWCGVPIKGRCDALTDEPLVDLKKVADGDMRLFRRNAYHFGYHIQAAMYRRIFQRDRFVLLTVEATPPYDVVPYELEADLLHHGETECIRLLQWWKNCCENSRWPGRSDEIQTLDLPEWVGSEAAAGLMVGDVKAF